MIIYDGNQAIIAATAKATKDFGISEVTESDVRHYTLRLIVEVKKKFSHVFGHDTVFALDSINGYWRKEIFPYYKYKRPDLKASMPFDMDFAHACMDKFYQEFQEFTPWRAIRVSGAEGDDVIGTLVFNKTPDPTELIDASEAEKILIVSSDEDFLHLQQRAGVDQWSSIKGQHIRTDNPMRNLFELIVKGDSGDGVPNATSEDDILVTKSRRQTSITQKKLDLWYADYMRDGTIAEEIATYFNRNKLLVDLSSIPDDIQKAILHQYDTVPRCKSKIKLLEYMAAKKIKGFDQDMQFF